MTNTVQPPGAAREVDADLTALVRRWMAAGTRVHERVRRDVAPREAPAPVPGADRPATVRPRADHTGLRAPGVLAPRAPALPHRPSAEEADHATRLAVLIDARRVSEDVAAGLLAGLGERGTVTVCRAYADWSRSELDSWVGRLRREGLHSFHQFADDDDQALVALAIDAVDIARDASVDEVVIAGDLTSVLPLVHRLHAAGVRVVLVGPAHTPHDVRAACDDFLDSDAVDPVASRPAGRHRA